MEDDNRRDNNNNNCNAIKNVNDNENINEIVRNDNTESGEAEYANKNYSTYGGDSQFIMIVLMLMLITFNNDFESSWMVTLINNSPKILSMVLKLMLDYQ